MIKIKLLKRIARNGIIYAAGLEFYVSGQQAKTWMQAGVAVPVPEHPEIPEKDLLASAEIR